MGERKSPPKDSQMGYSEDEVIRDYRSISSIRDDIVSSAGDALMLHEEAQAIARRHADSSEIFELFEEIEDITGLRDRGGT